MIKRLWEKVRAWFVGFPWLALGCFLVSTGLLLAFVVKGQLVWTDWLVGFLFTFIVVAGVWKIAKRQ